MSVLNGTRVRDVVEKGISWILEFHINSNKSSSVNLCEIGQLLETQEA
jgi:hypothetical protein